MVAPGSDISLHSLGGLWIIPIQPPSSSSRPPEHRVQHVHCETLSEMFYWRSKRFLR
jgi:hypothetical protein